MMTKPARSSLSLIVLFILFWSLEIFALKVAESAYVSMLGMATPVIVSVLAVVFLGENISLAQAIGALIILVSGVMTHRDAYKKQCSSRD